MRDAIRDGEVTHPMVHRIGNVAQSQPGAAARGLLGLMEQCAVDRVICSLPGPTVTEFVRSSYLLRMLHEKFPARFGEILGLGDEAKLSDFWGRMLPNSIELRSHPCFRGTGPADWKRIVPLTLHEDAGPYSKKKSTNVVSFNGLFGTGGEKLCQFVICSWIK